MDCDEEIKSLRRYLDDLASEKDDALERYELSSPRMPPGYYWRVRWVAGWMLRWLESTGLKQHDPWPPALTAYPGKKHALPILIWGVGSAPQKLREACLSFARIQSDLPDFVPVLVTDTADFAFFSRLRWLIEYLPRLSGDGDSYDQRKARFLARLYRGAPILPISAIPEICRRGIYGVDVQIGRLNRR